MKKAKRGIAGLLSMALVLGCLGSLPASAENTSSCISTIDENGVIHTKIGAETNITLATYAPDYKDIREEKPEYSEWIISIDRKSTRLNSSHTQKSRMPSSA